MDLMQFLKQNQNTRKIFGERELKIIEKQLSGINLTQSEKNRLSRDIRKKFDFIKEVSVFQGEFELKKASEVKKIIERARGVILEHSLRNKIQKILLFGSVVKNQITIRSDIDIAVVFDKIMKKQAFDFRKQVMGQLPDLVDIQVFNTLPEKIRNSILKDHRVLYEYER